MTSWRDQVAVVTGGARGIGRTTARLLAARGAAAVVRSRNKSASVRLGLTVVGALLPAVAVAAPPSGVCACYEARMALNAPGCVRSSLGCMGLVITVAPVMMFGLIDGATYSDYDGHRGRYSYSDQSGMLTMLDGSRLGWQYKRIAEWSFRAVDPAGKELPYTCPLDPKKDPLRRPW